MNRVVKTQLVVAVLVVLTCGLASAQSRTLRETYFDTGFLNGFSVPPATITTIGPVVDIVCPGTGTCTIEADHSIQSGPGNATGNSVTIGFMLDGNALNNSQVVGVVPTNGTFLVLSTTELEFNVSKGDHTVQTFVYSDDGMPIYNYNTTYRVYKP